MPNGNGFDPATSYARLNERVDNQAKDLVDLRSNINTGFANLQHSISTLSNSLAERNKPQWQAIGVALTFAVVIGGMAYWPIREATARLEATSSRMEDRMVTRQEMDWRQARSQEDRLRMENNVSAIRADQVPRQEHERVWQNYDQRLQDQQRQLDEVKQASSSVYGQRDALMDMRERLDRLERDRQRALMP